MGIIKRGILGGVSNKIGNVVGSSWKGIATLRSLPLSVANPNTYSQRQNRNSFALFSKLGSQVLSTVCQPLWNRDAKQMSGFNAYVMDNKRAYDEDPEAWAANPIMSKGRLSSKLLTCSYVTINSVLTVSWDETLVNPADDNSDLAYIQIISVNTTNPASPTYSAIGYANVIARSAGSVSLAGVPNRPESGKFIVSLSFKSEDGQEVATNSSMSIDFPQA